MGNLGRLLVLLGAGIAALGGLLLLAQRWRLPLGHLPGDIVFRGRHTTVYFPWVTMLILSIVLTLILNFFGKR